jgi:hypothetical protein
MVLEQVRLFVARLVVCGSLTLSLDNVRVLKSTLRTSKHCLGLPPLLAAAINQFTDRKTDERQISLAERVIEKAAFYHDRLTGAGDHNAAHALQVDRLSKEYYRVRMALVRCLLHSRIPCLPELPFSD